jgi:hypothetical protein
VRKAIEEQRAEKALQGLSKKYRLHFDQWQVLENEIMLGLLGLEEATNLADNIVKQVGVEKSVAESIVKDASELIFAPIREEIERQLDHPDAKEKEGTPIEDMTTEILKGVSEKPAISAEPQKDATITLGGTSYHAGTPSTERKDVHNDPYREQPL